MPISFHRTIDRRAPFNPRIFQEVLVLLGFRRVDILPNACTQTQITLLAITVHIIAGGSDLGAIEILSRDVDAHAVDDLFGHTGRYKVGSVR